MLTGAMAANADSPLTESIVSDQAKQIAQEQDQTQYRNRQRLERFIQLYGQGQRINMLEAALTAGFGSYPQFYRVFRDFMGCTPQEYKRSLG